MKPYFTTRDLALIGVVSGIMFVLGFVLAQTNRLFPGGPMLTQGPVYALLVIIAAGKVRKVWTVTLIGTIVGFLKLLVGCPIFVVVPMIAGFLAADVFNVAIRHRYCCYRCILPAGGIISVVTLLLLLALLALLGLPLMNVVKAHVRIAVGIGIGGTVLGSVGACVGFKIVTELKNAGVVE